MKSSPPLEMQEMPAEEELEAMDAENESENGENGDISYKQKYRALKRRLKYLVYEHECFEGDIQTAQTKLLQLSRDKSFLLDQLMRYETVLISDEDETDYSSTEEEGGPLGIPISFAAQLQKIEPVVTKSQPTSKVASSNVTAVPLTTTKLTTTTTTATTTATKTVANQPSATPPSVTKVTVVPKVGSRKQMKSGGSTNKLSATAAAKITKTVAKTRGHAPSPQHLIVSVPLSVTRATQSNKLEQPLAQVQPLAQPMQQPTHTQKEQPESVAEPTSSPSSSSSSSSSSSDSDDSGSDSSSSSEEEPMETGGPVAMVTSVTASGTSSSQLVRPKAIPSPVKPPPQLIQAISSGITRTPPPLLSPLTSPAAQVGVFSWSNRQIDSTTSSPSGGFIPIVPPHLTSPPSSAAFTALGKPLAGSAFHQVISPKFPPPALHSTTAITPTSK